MPLPAKCSVSAAASTEATGSTFASSRILAPRRARKSFRQTWKTLISIIYQRDNRRNLPARTATANFRWGIDEHIFHNFVSPHESRRARTNTEVQFFCHHGRDALRGLFGIRREHCPPARKLPRRV